MDMVVELAARALSVGDPLCALKNIALRDDAPALALRGIAMAQLGELGRAQKLLRRAARAFGTKDPLGRARCVVAEAEVALANRELSGSDIELNAALAVLSTRGDAANAAHGALVIARRWVLLGRLEQAERVLTDLDLKRAPARLVASAELVAAEIATRRLSTAEARRCLKRATIAAEKAKIPALIAEANVAARRLDAPAARLLEAGVARLVSLGDVEALRQTRALVVDACRRELRAGTTLTRLVERPVLFELLWALAEAFPNEAPRAELARRAFGSARLNESIRVRLRVEIGRLRKLLGKVAQITAGEHGFVLQPRTVRRVLVLMPPADTETDALLALLSDGQAWSTSGLAQALGKGQRTVQRALGMLETSGKVTWFGRGRGRRWRAPAFTSFATPLLLVARPEPR
ncbi:MAG TPA: helix-turn-helix domain-containing protein [Polyangiaceae bacterium]